MGDENKYRDIGSLNNSAIVNVPVDTERRGQVYQATHMGEQLLPYMRRSFISFTYGGKRIEDFDLIATQDNRLNRDGYAEFDDITSDYDNLDGQYYWNTHYKTNSMEFTLSTDGIDQRKLDNFLHWFRAGISRELILAEHPNRGIMARVAEPPHFNLLPFEHEVEIKISGNSYKTKTTLYKGDIELKLVMDQPYWYGLSNILGERREVLVGNQPLDRFVDKWVDVSTGESVDIFDSPDALKVLYEDGIPLGSVIDANMILGNGGYANVTNQTEGLIWSKNQTPEGNDWTRITLTDFYDGVGARIDGIFTESLYVTWTSGMCTEDSRRIATDNVTIVDSETGETTVVTDQDIKFDLDPTINREFKEYEYNKHYTGLIAGAVVDASGDGITSLSKRTSEDNGPYGYFFYSGTAPAHTQIKFTMTPQINADGYIVSPLNSYSEGTEKENTITIESITKQELKFTTPNIFTSYNKAVNIFRTKLSDVEMTWEKLRAEIRDNVRHAGIRAWAVSIIDNQANNSMPSINNLNSLLAGLRQVFPQQMSPATFIFNSETGEAIGQFEYKTSNNDGTFSTGYEKVEENVGDMLKSNYIIIQDRNHYTAEGRISSWTTDDPGQSYRIYHDVDGGLTNLQILYKNMYL